MAKHQIIFRGSRSIAGPALFGVGLFILYQNVGGAVACATHILLHHSSSLGTVPALILGLAQVLKCHAASTPWSSNSLVQHALLSSWPLLLVVVGTVLSGEEVVDSAAPVGEKVLELSRSELPVRRANRGSFIPSQTRTRPCV
jgi:hypothetical protein